MNVNQTSVQLLKILASQQKIKKSKKTHTKTIYPKGIENKYKSKLSLYFKPLIDYVNKYINENKTELLKGDSKEIKLDAIPGESYRNMVKNMEGWLAVNIPENPEDNSRVYLGLKETANQLKDFQDKEFEKQLEKSIGVSIKEQSEWWNNMIDSWSDTNYQLIKSNARNFVNKINVIVEQSITNGTTVSELKQAIQKATSGLSDAKCRLLARDQIGKLQGQISQGQMTELGLELYIWSTSGDERVRDSHLEMEGLLCRWDDASVYSEDGGKTWIPRPSGAIEMHPGQDIQCRCVALAYFPEIDSVITGEPMEIIESEEVEEKIEITELNEKEIKYFEKLYNYQGSKYPSDIVGKFTSSKDVDILIERLKISNLQDSEKKYILSYLNKSKELFEIMESNKLNMNLLNNKAFMKEITVPYLQYGSNKELILMNASTIQKYIDSSICSNISIKYKDKYLYNYIQNNKYFESQEGFPWGQATPINDNAKAFAFLNSSKYIPRVGTTMMYDYSGEISVTKLGEWIKYKQYAEEQMKNVVVSSKDMKYALRAEQRLKNEIDDFKVGKKIDLTGCTATTLSEEHNWFWLKEQASRDFSKENILVRYHIERNNTFEKSIGMIQTEDIVLDNPASKKYPQEITSGIRGFEITKVEKSEKNLAKFEDEKDMRTLLDVWVKPYD